MENRNLLGYNKYIHIGIGIGVTITMGTLIGFICGYTTAKKTLDK